MRASRAEEEGDRLDRLAGDGTGGGGLPLPLVFGTILEELLDNGPAHTGRLVEVTRERQDFNTGRILATWQSWEHFTRDVLTQLESRRFIARREDGLWEGTFTSGSKLTVIRRRAGKNRNPICVTVYRRDEREQRGRAEEKAMTVTEYAQRLRGHGLREVSARRVEEIRASIREFGDHRDAFPVLVDQHGNLLDGRHRLSVDPGWPRRAHRVDSDEDMLQVALVANQGAAWSRKDWADLAHLVKAVGGQRQKREIIRQALAEHPEASHRDIAKMLGNVNMEKTVTAACTSLRGSPEFPDFSCCHGTTGQGARTDRQPGPHAEAEARVEELLRENPQQSDKQILAAVGLSDNQHRVVKRVRDRLEAEGAIPPAPAREGADGRVRRVPGEAPPPPAPSAAPSQPPPDAPQGEPRAPRRTRPQGLMQRIARIVARWEAEEPDDPASEISDLEELRREIDERIAALRG